MVICYARLLYTVTVYPGLVPCGRQWYLQKQNASRSRKTRNGRRRHRDTEKVKNVESDAWDDSDLTNAIARRTAHDATLQVEDFWQRDTFVCGHDGRPAFCSTCFNWKPDRTHHCSELDRCVLKMDHFCPWVGGVVGETSFKFFLQFVFWAALFCTHVLITVAYYLARRRRLYGVVNAHWAVALGMAGLFLLFSAGMCMSTLQFVLINSTTIENLTRKSKVWYLAVHVPDHVFEQIQQRGRSNLRFITYPRPPSEQLQVLEQNGAEMPQEAHEQAAASERHPQPVGPPSRTFAILETVPGTNPFDLGWKRNFVDIMGPGIFDWLLPIRQSPCVRHDSSESFYAMGPAVRLMKEEAGIVSRSAHADTKRKRSRRRSRRRSGHSHHRSRSRRLDGEQ